MNSLFQPQPLPGPTKTPKTPKVVLTLCSFDVEEHHVELELSQTRIGKIVKFQFGILDNEAEEIAENLVKEGHLVEENKADFLSQLNTIVQEQRDVAKAQQEEVDEAEEPEVVCDDVIEPSDKVVETDSPSEPASMETSSSNNNGDLSIEVRQRLSRENVAANHSSNNHNNHVTNSGNHVTSPDLDTRSQLSESGSNIPIDTFNSAKSLMNGMDTLKSPPVAVSGAMPFTSNYFRQQGGMMFYPQPTPQYMMMPPGAGMHQMPPQMPGHHQLPGALQHNSYMVMPPSLYPNGHIAAGWGHGAPIVRSQAELNAMRLPVTATGHPLTAGAAHHVATAVPHMSGGAAHHMSPYMGGCGTQNTKVEKDTRQIVRGDQDTPPPTFRPDLVATPIDSRLET